MQIQRCDSGHPDFQALVQALDRDLAQRNGDSNAFFAQFNTLTAIRHVVLAYADTTAVGCGAFKEYAPGVVEIKRMYVLPAFRGRGVGAQVLAGLEGWAAELGYAQCILETGLKQPEAIALYRKCNYRQIPNYGQYAEVADSVCFEKSI